MFKWRRTSSSHNRNTASITAADPVPGLVIELRVRNRHAASGEPEVGVAHSLADAVPVHKPAMPQ